MQTLDLDRLAINDLSLKLLAIIARYYEIRPPSADVSYEILEAIAITVATVCRKIGDDEAVMWFRAAFEIQVKDLWK